MTIPETQMAITTNRIILVFFILNQDYEANVQKMSAACPDIRQVSCGTEPKITTFAA
jgi:hypothetical protein